MLVSERNVVSSLVYVGMHPGKCLEYNIDKDTSLLTRDEIFKDFMERPYAIIPLREKKYLLIVPKWTGFRVDWLESQTEKYYIFRVDRYAAWSGLVSDELKKDLDLSPRYASIRLEDNNDGARYSCLVGNEPEIEDAWIRYREYLLRKEKYKRASEEGEERIPIKSSVSARFNLASKLIMDGIIPWAGRKVEQSWKWPTDIQLRPYQKEAMDFFIEHGSMTLVHPFGSGKTLFGVQAISCVSGRTLVVVPSVSQIAVWQKYIKQHFLPNSKPCLRLLYGGARRKNNIYAADIIISTYESALTHLTKEHFKLLIFDECHHFPANTYSRLAFLDAQYRIGLSGSPYREDGRSELIYILSGAPYGSDWDTLFEEGWVRKPEVNLHVSNAKMSLMQSMLQKRLKGNTIIFCDTISLGEEAARLTGLPFIYGQHSLSKRIEAINKYHRLISSRIFDEGMDIPNIKYIIEIDFLGGSRRQQLQRVGRLMHSLIDGAEYHLIMSPYELKKYEKRLYGLYSRQFSVNVIKEP